MAIYANTLWNEFVYDDTATIANNRLIKDLYNLPTLFKKDYFLHSGEMTYRPVVTLTYFLDYSLSGLNPFGYHITNILLHALNSVLLYTLLTLIVQGSTVLPPLFAALLFAAHPVLTEAVNGISYREDLLTFFFYISTFLMYLRSRSNTSSLNIAICLLSCLTYLLALLSKEMAMTLPLVIYCYEWIYGRRKNTGWWSRYSIGYLVTTLVYIYLRFYHFTNPAENTLATGSSITERLLTIPWLLLNYLKMALFPISLSADYVVMPVKSIASLSFILPSAVVASLIIIAFAARRRQGWLTFGVLFFFVTLLPVYGIIPVSCPLAERYLYLPLAGIAIIAGMLINAAISRTRLFHIAIPVIVVLSIYSLTVTKRNVAWSSDYSLWSDTVRKAPNSSHAYHGLANAYHKEGRLTEAARSYQTVLMLNPYDAEAHYNLGVIYDKQGSPMDAVILEYQTAIKLRPDLSDAYTNLGAVYYKQGRLDEALEQYQTALARNPSDFNAYYNLGHIYYKQGQPEKALEMYNATLKLEPEFAMARYHLGIVYSKKGLKDNARMEFEAALKLRPDLSAARKALETVGENE